MSHYYNKEVTTKSNPETIPFRAFDIDFKFITDHGVFSKGSIDYGTQMLLKHLVKESIQGPVLDVGCGYGVMGVVLNKVLQIEVDMVDVNERALVLATQNIELNHCDSLHVFASDVYSNVERSYQTIITNPPIRAGKDVVHDILNNSYKHLNDNGVLYAVIQKKQGAPSAIKSLEQYYQKVSIIGRENGYYVIKAEKSLQRKVVVVE